ncbi:MAG TPA: alpha/beta fold hydrolase, partial [Acidimicrobiales bacterium]|nr:alpha/beta fold hydrolase [Acidimicrobiales bacterium]
FPGGSPMVFGHGLGTDQTMWDQLTPAFEHDHRVVVFDHAGSGRALLAHDPARHGTLEGYADDLVDLLDELDLPPVTFVGHSASAMVGVLAHVRRPERFAALVLVGGSPRYLDGDGWPGGMTEAEVEDFLAAMERNHLAWAASVAPVVMANPDRPELAADLAERFARADAATALSFARAILTSDHRDALGTVRVPTLVLQSEDDPMVPDEVAVRLAAAIPGAQLVRLAARGHFPHLSGRDETAAAIRSFVDRLP